MYRWIGQWLIVYLGVSGIAPVMALSDPTKPASYVVSKNQGQNTVSVDNRELRVQSVLVSDTRRLAVINGRSYGVGEVVDDAEITLIDRSGVTVVRRGKEQRLHFMDSGIKKTRLEEY